MRVVRCDNLPVQSLVTLVAEVTNNLHLALHHEFHQTRVLFSVTGSCYVFRGRIHPSEKRRGQDVGRYLRLRPRNTIAYHNSHGFDVHTRPLSRLSPGFLWPVLNGWVRRSRHQTLSSASFARSAPQTIWRHRPARQLDLLTSLLSRCKSRASSSPLASNAENCLL